MNRRVFFRSDGNAEIGLGHVYRSLALAEMLKREFELHFVIRTPSKELKEDIFCVCSHIHELSECHKGSKEEADELLGFVEKSDIIVLDGYCFNEAYQIACRKKGNKVISIDDMHNHHYYSDVVINHCGSLNKNNFSTEPYTQLLLGEQYALLRPPFLEAARKKKSNDKGIINSVFLSFGGSDYKNLTCKYLKFLCQNSGITSINIIVGSAYQYQKELNELIPKIDKEIKLYQNISGSEVCNLLQKSHLAVVPSSTICIEASAVGIGLVSGFYANNQKDLSKWVEAQNLGSTLGNLDKVTSRKFSDVLKEITPETIKQMIENQKIVDGYSDRRFLNVFKSL